MSENSIYRAVVSLSGGNRILCLISAKTFMRAKALVMLWAERELNEDFRLVALAGTQYVAVIGGDHGPQWEVKYTITRAMKKVEESLLVIAGDFDAAVKAATDYIDAPNGYGDFTGIYLASQATMLNFPSTVTENRGPKLVEG